MVPPYEPEMVLPGRNMDVGIMDIDRDIHVVPDVFPVVVNEAAVEPISLPVVVETGPLVGCESDLYWSEQNVEVDMVDIRRDIRNLSDVFPVMFNKMATVPMTLPVNVNMGPQVEEDPGRGVDRTGYGSG